MPRFDESNAPDLNQHQLDELNRRFDVATSQVTEDTPDRDKVLDAIAEKIKAQFDEDPSPPKG